MVERGRRRSSAAATRRSDSLPSRSSSCPPTPTTASRVTAPRADRSGSSMYYIEHTVNIVRRQCKRAPGPVGNTRMCRPLSHPRTTAAALSVVETPLDKGLVINADIFVSVAGVELRGIKIRAAIYSFVTMPSYRGGCDGARDALRRQ